MKLIGLLSFFDEPVPDLVACLTGLKEAGVDEIVAVDGRYAMFPSEQDVSDANQHAAVVLAARNLGMGCTLHVPSAAWAGNEVEKRTFLFSLALPLADHGDWYWVMDADQVVTRAPDDLKTRLRHTEHDAAEVQFLDVVALRANQKDWPPYFAVRNFFRAQPVHLWKNHATYFTKDKRLLWGWDETIPLEPALDLTDSVLVEHRPDRRSTDRQLAKLTYYANRDKSQIERGWCKCRQRSVALVAVNWRWSEIGPVADWKEACERCAKRLNRQARRQLTEMGIDPDSVEVENRNGRPPAELVPQN